MSCLPSMWALVSFPVYQSCLGGLKAYGAQTGPVLASLVDKYAAFLGHWECGQCVTHTHTRTLTAHLAFEMGICAPKCEASLQVAYTTLAINLLSRSLRKTFTAWPIVGPLFGPSSAPVPAPYPCPLPLHIAQPFFACSSRAN